MTNEVARYNFNMPLGNELDQLITFCTVMANCPYYTKLGAAGIMSIYLTAKELNLPFMASLNGGMYPVNGLVTLSAQMMNMMIVNAGHRVKILQFTDQICELELIRTDRTEDTTLKYSYTYEQAKVAGLVGKDNWKKNPRDMLFARALSGGARKHMPDVLMNCYVMGEIPDEKLPEEPYEDVTPKPLETLCITSQQVNELSSIVSQCSPPYVEWLTKNLNTLGKKLSEVSPDDYALIKQSATNDMLEYQKVKKAEDVK